MTAADETAELSPLERRYRRLLQVLPRGYRDLREQEMVDIFLEVELDDDDPEFVDLIAQYGRPGFRETISVLLLAARLRWSGVDVPQRARERERALTFAVTAGLTVLAVMAVHVGFANLWFVASHPEYGATDPGATRTFGDYIVTAYSWSFVLWLGGFIAAVCGRPRWAQVLCLLPAINCLAVAAAFPWMIGYWAEAMVQVAVVIGLTGVPPRRASAATRAWIVAFCAGVLILTATVLLAVKFMPESFSAVLLNAAGFWWLAAIVSGAGVLVRLIRRRSVTTGGLLGVAGLACVAAILIGGNLVDLARLLPSEDEVLTRIVLVAGVQLLMVVLVAVAVGVAGIRRFRRLPPIRYDTVVGVPAGHATHQAGY